MYQLQQWNKKFLAAFLAFALPASVTHASGFRIPEVSVTGTATSNALVATTDELGAIPYNPAAMSFHEGKYVMAGVNVIGYETEYTRPTPPGGTVKGTGEDTFLVPNLLVGVTGDNDMGFSVAVNSPFGLETQWPAGTFTSFAGPAAVLEPTLSRIKMFNVNPNLSYKIDKNTSVAVGVDIYDVVDLSFNTQGIFIRGSGSGVGMNFGFLQKMGKFNFGFSYRSSVTTGLTGNMDPTGAAPPGAATVIGVNAKLEFPDILQFGVQYNPTDNIGIEVDLDRTGWSSFDTINVRDASGAVQVSSTNNWEDSWAFRTGLHWKITSGTKLMLGYSYDNTPQPDQYFSARVPDADRQLFSIGASHEINNWKIEYAYMYVDVDKRTVNSSTPFNPADPNGTTAYNGTYESKVNLIGLSASVKF